MSHEITWRRYDLNDRAAALRLKVEQDQVLGQPMDFCDLTQHPVLVAEVGELEGEIIGLHTLEAVPEYCVFSRDPRFTKAAIARAPKVAHLLGEHGFRTIRCFVPEWLGADTDTITRALRSVEVPVGEEIRHFEPRLGLRHMALDLCVKTEKG
jgi:hypothetical protein